VVGASGAWRSGGCVALLAVVAGAGCDSLQPETGDLRMECVDTDSDPTKPVVFKTDIRPLMNGQVAGTKGCKLCHYPNNAAGTREGFLETGLNLETLQSLRRGGRSTPPESIIVPGKPCSSAIVKKLQGTFGSARMPKGGPYWDAAKIQLVIDWIAEGAQGADDE
jgi:hypothetical protein